MEEAGFLVPAGFAVLASLVAAGLFARRLARGKWAPAPSGDRHVALDGLRGFLALAVVSHHFLIWLGMAKFGRGWAPPAFFPFNHLGLGAVTLFFMITGYVFQPWIARGDLRRWPRLALRRLFRLQPLVALSVALVCAVCLARGGAFDARSSNAGSWRSALLWLSCWSEPDLLGIAGAGRINAYVLWSLKFEWLFTLVLLPICALAARGLRGRAPGWLAPGGLLLLFSGAGVLLPGEGAAATIAIFAPPFLIGMIAHEALARERVRAGFASPWALAAAMLALGFAMMRAPTPFSTPQLALYSLLFCCVAARRELPALTGAGAQALGAWSYPIYLLHGLLLSLLFVEGGARVATASPLTLLALLPALACLTVAVAAFAHRTVERPAADFGRDLAARWPMLRRVEPAPAKP
jgi:peptidoglycan/LPS O-acetylase OafA/YrhL